METGVSYFSSRTLRHASDDLQEMVDQACSSVAHGYRETALAYYRDTIRDIVGASHGAGLEAWLDPWGLAGIFSGETFTRFPLDHPEAWQLLSDGRRAGAACPNHPATRAVPRGRGLSCGAGSTPAGRREETSCSGTSLTFTSACGAATSRGPGPVAAKPA